MRTLIATIALAAALVIGTLIPVLADEPPPGIKKPNTPSHGQLHHGN